MPLAAVKVPSAESSEEMSASRDAPVQTGLAESLKRSQPVSRRVLIVGFLALACLVVSITLAVSALLVALSVNAKQSLVAALFSVGDFFAGPISGLFNFSAQGGIDRERLVTYGVASLIYLIVGMFLSSRIERKPS